MGGRQSGAGQRRAAHSQDGVPGQLAVYLARAGGGKSMSRDDIIKMADASGISLYGMGLDREKFIQYLESFATLVAFAERQAILGLADSLGWVNIDHITAREQA